MPDRSAKTSWLQPFSSRSFLRVARWLPPQGPGIRVDSHIVEGATIPPYYDSMVAKLIVHGTTREAAVARLTAALDDFQIDGVATTLDLHKRIVRHPDYIANRVNTRWLETSLLGTER